MLFAHSQSPEARGSVASDRAPYFEDNVVSSLTISPTSGEERGGVGTADVSPQHQQRSVYGQNDQNHRSVDDDGDKNSAVLGCGRGHVQEEGVLIGDGKHRVESSFDVVLRAAVDHVERPKRSPDAAVVAPTAELSTHLPITVDSNNNDTRSLGGMASRGGGGGVVGGVATNMAVDGRRGDRETSANGKDGELFFDPVLNCYYDRAADKYYGLC